jgi:transposase
MEHNTIGLDIAKRVFQAHWIEESTGEIRREKFKRSEVPEFFAKLKKAVVVMEACGSAHHWARKFREYGHEVRLIAAQFVRPYVKTNKTDQADAEAICEAAKRPGMRFVAVKSEQQQAVLALHRQRQLLVRFRTMQVNQLRGILYEFGEVLPEGRAKATKEASGALARLEGRIAGPLLESLKEQIQRLGKLEEEIEGLELRLAMWKKGDEATRRVAEIPGVGLITATALTATMGDPGVFKSGREFAAFLGLVPRQSGTGGKVRLLGISKRGDVYLRTLLIHGARSVLYHKKERPKWLEKMLARRPANVVAVALANRTARTAWALLAHGNRYQAGYASTRPA